MKKDGSMSADDTAKCDKMKKDAMAMKKGSMSVNLKMLRSKIRYHAGRLPATVLTLVSVSHLPGVRVNNNSNMK